MTDPIDLGGLRAKAEAATPGPREAVHGDRHHLDLVQTRYLSGEPSILAMVGGSEIEQQNADSEFIAACDPQTILSLISLAEDAGRYREALESADTLLKAGFVTAAHAQIVSALQPNRRVVTKERRVNAYLVETDDAGQPYYHAGRNDTGFDGWNPDQRTNQLRSRERPDGPERGGA